jgi:hypothetical protein
MAMQGATMALVVKIAPVGCCFLGPNVAQQKASEMKSNILAIGILCKCLLFNIMHTATVDNTT